MSQTEPKAVRYLEALLLIALLVVGIAFIVPAFKSKSRPGFSLPGFIECEELKVKAKSPNVFFQAQSTKEFSSGVWSKDQHMFGLAYAVGDWLELSVPVNAAGKYRIDTFLSKASDYSTIQFILDGSDFGSAIDLWSSQGTVTNTGRITLGEVDLAPGSHILRIEIRGKNPGNTSPHYFFGIDGFILQKI